MEIYKHAGVLISVDIYAQKLKYLQHPILRYT